MIYFYDGNGSLIKSVPNQVYQGSNKANTIYFVAPLSGVVDVAFTLPNGNIVPRKTMTYLATLPETVDLNGAEYSVWTYSLPFAISKYSGRATMQFFVYTGTETIASQSANLFIQSGVPEVGGGESGNNDELEQQVASLIAWKNSLTFRFVDNYSGDFKDLKPGINYVRTNQNTTNLPSFVTSDSDEVVVLVQYDGPKNQRITLCLQNKVAFMTYDYANQTWTEWEEKDLLSGGGSGSGSSAIYEQVTIPASAWSDLSNSQPFFYQATITLTTPLTATSKLAILRDDPVFFANFGVCIGGDNGQEITLYATSVPPLNKTITMVIGG